MDIRKICIGLVAFSTLNFAFAAEKNQFDMFDNRIYLSAGGNFGVLHNDWDQTAKYLAGDAGIGVEKLFPTSRVWLNVNLSNLMAYHELDNNLAQATKNPLPFDPQFFSMNLKLGRAFQVVQDDLQITPYVLLGKNGNLSPNTVLNSAVDKDQVKYINSGLGNFFWTTGIGGRLEYAVNDIFDFYLDENLNYNADNSKPQGGFSKLNNVELMNTLGVKWQAWRELQFAVEGYADYQKHTLQMSTDQLSQFNPYVSFGTRFQVGLTF